MQNSYYEDSEIYVLTHEQHLKHMGQVVPFVFIIYLAQCYLINNYYDNQGTLLLVLGFCIAAMVGALLFYDGQHRGFYRPISGQIFVRFWKTKEIRLNQISQIVALCDEDALFGTLKITTLEGKSYKFYFVDFPHKWVDLIEKSLKKEEMLKAA